jgi:subtilisin family serine protease
MKVMVTSLGATALALVLGTGGTVPALADDPSPEDQEFEKFAEWNDANRDLQDAAASEATARDGVDAARAVRDAAAKDLDRASDALRTAREAERTLPPGSSRHERLQRRSDIDAARGRVNEAQGALDDANQALQEAEQSYADTRAEREEAEKQASRVKQELDALRARKEQAADPPVGPVDQGSTLGARAPPAPDALTAPGPALSELDSLGGNVAEARRQGAAALDDIDTALSQPCDRAAFEAARGRLQSALQSLAKIADLAQAGLQAASFQGVSSAAHAALNELADRWKTLEASWQERCGGIAMCAPPGGVAIAGGPAGGGSPPAPAPPRPGGAPPEPDAPPAPKKPDPDPDKNPAQGANGQGPGAGSGAAPRPDGGALPAGATRPGQGESPDVLAAGCAPAGNPGAPAASPAQTAVMNAIDLRADNLRRQDGGQLRNAGAVAMTETGWQALAVGDVYMPGAYLNQLRQFYTLRYGEAALPPQFAAGNALQATRQLVDMLDEIRWLKEANPTIVSGFGLGSGAVRYGTGLIRGYFRLHRSNPVLYGDTVFLHPPGDGTPLEYNLVTPDRSDHERTLSSNDALGRLLLGRKNGDEVTIDGQTYRVEIRTTRLTVGQHDAAATERLASLEAELASFLGMPDPGAPLPEEMANLLATGATTLHRQARRIPSLIGRLEAATRARTEGYQQVAYDLDRTARMSGVSPQERQAVLQRAQERRAELDQAVANAQRDLNQAFQGFSILRMAVDGQPLWQALNGLAPGESGKDLIQRALEQQASTTVERIVWWGTEASPRDKVELLGSQPFASVRLQISGDPSFQALLPTCTLTRGMDVVRDASVALVGGDEARHRRTQTRMMAAAVPLIFVSGPLGYVADRAAGAANIVEEFRFYSAGVARAEQFQREAEIGVIAQGDLGAWDRPPSAFGVVVTVAGEGVAALLPVALPRILRATRGDGVVSEIVEDAATLGGRAAGTAGDVAGAGSAAGRGAATVTSSLADGAAIVDRIDPKVLNVPSWRGNPGNAAFFKTHGLTPELTVEVGGQTFHLSRPFQAPGNRVAVVAFQETTAGTVIPRTFYLSNEHGAWRAATGFGRNLLFKGPVVDAAGKIAFANETAADVAAEMQGVLNRWHGERGAVSLPSKADAERAFLGHLDFNEEYRLFVNQADVELALPAGARPDFATGPLDRWTVQSPLYGPVEGFLYRSTDGSALYVVLRDQAGHVWVPGIQDTTAGLTPFGTRWEAYKSGFTTTPKMHNPDFADGLPVSPTNQPYIDNPAYRNPLNELFANNLPAAGTPAAGSTAAVPAGGAIGARLGGARAGAGDAVTGGGRGVDSAVRTASGDASAPAGAQLGRMAGYVARLFASTSGPFSLITAHAPLCFSRIGTPVAVPAEAGGGHLVPVETKTPDTFRSALGTAREFGYLEPNKPLDAQGPDDQWAFQRIGVAPGGRAGLLVDTPGEASHPVIVATLDSGLDYFHPDLPRENVWRNPVEVSNGRDDDGNGYVDDLLGWNFVDGDNNPWDGMGHGTHVAGIVAGVNPRVRIMPLKILDATGRGRTIGLAEAVFYAVRHGARVVNLSLGGHGVSKTERLALDYAHRKGVIVVVAAGNAGKDTADHGPAGLPTALTVAATGLDDRRAGFSNFGHAVKIAAPGVDIVSLRARRTDINLAMRITGYEAGSAFVGPRASHYRASGTSFAAPFVSGVASLVLGRNPALTGAQAERMLVMSADDVEVPGWDRFTGAGRLNAVAALRADPDRYLLARVTAVRPARKGTRTVIQVHGTAVGSDFRHYTLELARGETPVAWKPVGTERTAPVEDGLLGTIPIGEITARGTWTIRVVARDGAGHQREARGTLTVD